MLSYHKFDEKMQNKLNMKKALRGGGGFEENVTLELHVGGGIKISEK